MAKILLACALFSLSVASLGQSETPSLPCAWSGELFRAANGSPARFNSTEMKARATRKVDVSAFVKQLDIKTTAVVDILVDSSGRVVCSKTMAGLPIVRRPIESALQSWRFKPLSDRGEAMGYLGQLQFTLCNINCGDVERGISLLK